jgi:6-pyruvoyltetrahydropterin/6-carboxytetrahydropterin synthase
MYEVMVQKHFSSAHNLRGYEGKCEALHGHNWSVEVVVRAEKLNAIGIAVDFKDIKEALDEQMEKLDHKYLNETPPFDEINPTTENIAKFLYDTLSKLLNDDCLRIYRINVWESPGSCGSYFVD